VASVFDQAITLAAATSAQDESLFWAIRSGWRRSGDLLAGRPALNFRAGYRNGTLFFQAFASIRYGFGLLAVQ
jgi:hypothetical protein